MRVAMGIAAVHAVLASRSQRSPVTAAGRRRLPFVASLFLPGVLLALRNPDLRSRQRRKTGVTMGLIGAAGYASLPERARWRDALGEVDGLVGLVLRCWRPWSSGATTPPTGR
jgi:hypothetical protein